MRPRFHVIWLVALLFLISPRLGFSQSSVVQKACAQQSTATTTPIPFTSNPVTGHSIIAVIKHTTGSTIQGVADTLGNSFAARGVSFVVAGVRHDVYGAQNISNISSSADTVTVTNDSANALAACIYEIAGVTATAFDQITAGATGTSATATTTASGTTAQANEFLFEACIKDHSEQYTAGLIGGTTGTLLDSFTATDGEMIGTQWNRVTNGPATYTGAMGTGNASSSWGCKLLTLREANIQNLSGNVSETLTTSDSVGRSRFVVRRIVESAWFVVKRAVIGK